MGLQDHNWRRRFSVPKATGGLFSVAALVALWLGWFGVAPAEEVPERCRGVAEQTQGVGPLPYRPNAFEDLVYLRVAGVRYAIPENYFRYPPIGCDAEESGFLLRVLFPTFEGWTKERDEEFRGTPERPWVGMNILLQSAPNPNMAGTFRVYARGADPMRDYLRWSGLLRTKNSQGDDVFFARERDRVTFLMVCNTVDRVPYPTCSQYSLYRGAKLKVLFQRTNLKNWQAIHEGTLALLDGFAVSASKKKGE